MKKVYALTLICIFNSLFGQRPTGNIPKLKLTGIVLDQETQQTLEYATISLKNTKNPDRLQGGITGFDGKFMVDVFPGTYDISIEYIGFDRFTKTGVLIKSSMDLGTIGLTIGSTALEGVEVMAEKTEVEIRLDKRIYNVGKDLTVRGGSVADVLDNVPSVTVDIEGNVALRGNDNVRILINGKPSGLVGISGPQGLQQLPAESIEKVEVVTSPSARYGAEGTAGILNIILKKQELLGFNGNFVANAGQTHTDIIPSAYGGSANVNLRKNKFNIFSTNSYSKSLSIGNVFNENEYFNGENPSTFLEESRSPERENFSFFSSLGVEYYFKEKTSLILSGFIRDRSGDDYTKNILKRFDENKVLIDQSQLIELETDKDDARQISLNFDSEMDEEGQKFTAVFQYEENKEDEKADIDNSLKNRDEKVNQLESEKRILLQADYVLPLDKNTQFEFGYRGNFNNQETDYQVFQIQNGGFARNTDLSNVLIYKEHINALYTQYGKKIDAFSFLIGLRMEDSKIIVDQRTINDYNQKKYTKFFPTLNLSYEFSDTESIILGYSRRISRPRGRFLNPFPSRSSVANFFQGNADLDPSYSNTVDVGYLKRWDKVTFNTSVYYQKSTEVFTFIAEDSGQKVIVSEGESTTDFIEVPIIVRSPINIAENNRTGFEFTLSYNPSRKSRIFLNFNLFNSETIGIHEGVDLGRTNLSWFSRANAKFTIFKDIDWQTQVFFRGPRETAQSKSRGMIFTSMALSKDVFKKKGTLSFRVSDLFNTAMYRSKTFTPTFTNDALYRRSLPSFNLSLTYRINQKDKPQSRRPQGGGGGNNDGGFGF
ncbi:MAG: TonB-dependent receptor [Flavobacteriaceae bacterium]|jgi:outer membrane receptor protein involved in Fe transport|nr:TonB-dependent receptor [Flavobacteriaceae bacterium]MBT6127959.1 TonB-dependent receptor [Flavobacteriaceae bacterium]